MNLINSDGTLHRNNAKRFIQAVYDYANGRINYINKSKYLKFTELESEDSSHSITAERMLDHIEINLSSIELFSRISHYGIPTLLLYTLGNDQIDLPGFAVVYHTVECIPVLKGSS